MPEEIFQSGPIESIGQIFTTGRIVAAIAVVAVAWVLLKLLYFLSQWTASRFGRYRMQITGLYPVARLLVWIVATYLIIVDVFQPPANSLLALLASAGLAVGLAAQDVIRNVISGILILFEKPFRVGDMVRIGDYYGEVVSIGLRSVQLHTFDDSRVTIPNATVTSQMVSNSNSGELNEMVVTSFTVPASLDVESVKNLAWEAASCSPYVYLKKPIIVLAEDVFNRTFLTRFTVKAYVLDVRLERMFASDILERVKKTLIDNGLITPELVLGALTSRET
ncbi:MAG: mechanosensitive ion channel family protein [Gammaproteobacteria bacterium]|nr:mechanosensitive ion channel family protein [Gammaproteobacteria bacterium]